MKYVAKNYGDLKFPLGVCELHYSFVKDITKSSDCVDHINFVYAHKPTCNCYLIANDVLFDILIKPVIAYYLYNTKTLDPLEDVFNYFKYVSNAFTPSYLQSSEAIRNHIQKITKYQAVSNASDVITKYESEITHPVNTITKLVNDKIDQYRFSFEYDDFLYPLDSYRSIWLACNITNDYFELAVINTSNALLVKDAISPSFIARNKLSDYRCQNFISQLRFAEEIVKKCDPTTVVSYINFIQSLPEEYNEEDVYTKFLNFIVENPTRSKDIMRLIQLGNNAKLCNKLNRVINEDNCTDGNVVIYKLRNCKQRLINDENKYLVGLADSTNTETSSEGLYTFNYLDQNATLLNESYELSDFGIVKGFKTIKEAYHYINMAYNKSIKDAHTLDRGDRDEYDIYQKYNGSTLAGYLVSGWFDKDYKLTETNRFYNDTADL